MGFDSQLSRWESQPAGCGFDPLSYTEAPRFGGWVRVLVEIWAVGDSGGVVVVEIWAVGESGAAGDMGGGGGGGGGGSVMSSVH